MSRYNRKDALYQRAKDEGFRSRAAYKLKELNKKYKFLRPGARVVELGAWPGGWLQVIAQEIGPTGVGIGVDLVPIESLGLPQVISVTGDLRDEGVQNEIVTHSGGLLDAVLSDMSPKLTGIREADAMQTVACAELAFHIAEKLLRPAGIFVTKVFKSNEADQFVKMIRPRFNQLQREELDATRATSNEYYVVGIGFRGASK